MSLFSSLRTVHKSCPSLARQTRLGVAGLHQDQGKLDRFALASKYKGLEKNVWVDFMQLALEYQPLNLGQGLPDDLVPTYVLDSLRDVVNDPSVFMHQYTRGFVSLIKIFQPITITCTGVCSRVTLDWWQPSPTCTPSCWAGPPL